MPVGNFNLPLQGEYWTPPSDWINIESVGNNEINILTSDNYPIKFTVTMALGGTFSIDWGDGVIETGRTSGTGYVHTYTLGGGTPCSLGYTTYKIRIYNATNPITQFGFSSLGVSDLPSPLKQQFGLYGPLWIVFGTNDLTSLSQMTFASGGNYFCHQLQAVYLPNDISKITNWARTFQDCVALRMVKGLNQPWSTGVTSCALMFASCHNITQINLPETLPNAITSFQNMFSLCYNLKYIKIPNWPTSLTTTGLQLMFNFCTSLQKIDMPSALPNGPTSLSQMFNANYALKEIAITSWPNTLTSTSSMFNTCYSLTKVTLPSGGFPASCTTISDMFAFCYNISEIDLGTSWGGIQTMSNTFSTCGSLKKVTYPTTLSTTITSATNHFLNSRQITTLVNGSSIGTSTAGAGTSLANFSGVGSVNMITGFTTNSYLSSFGFRGDANNFGVLQSLRLTQAGSTYTGTSPQINVSFQNLSQAALVQIFNDLPTLTAKTINITSCTGAAALTPAERAIATGKGWTITG